MATQDVVYDSFSFTNNGCVLTLIDHMTLAPRKNQVETRADRSGGVLVQSFYSTKPVYIEGTYTGVDITDAQTTYDTLAAVFNRQARNLTVSHAGGVRTYVATPENVVIKEPDGLNRLTFSAEFVVPEGSAKDSTTTTLVSGSTTGASATFPLIVDGSVKARPYITITFGTITGGTSQTVNIRNSRDFIGLSITRSWSTGDILVIDSENFLIYINGVKYTPTSATGRFPTWEPGSGALNYSDTLTTRSMTITATYYKQYL